MITKIFLKFLKQHLKAANLVGCVEIQWDRATESVTSISLAIRKRIAKVQLFSVFIYSALQLSLTAFSKHSAASKLRAITFTGIYVTAFFLIWGTERASMHLLNSFIKFENMLLNGENFYIIIFSKFWELMYLCRQVVLHEKLSVS